jgi:GTP cyclohydrolase II
MEHIKLQIGTATKETCFAPDDLADTTIGMLDELDFSDSNMHQVVQECAKAVKDWMALQDKEKASTTPTRLVSIDVECTKELIYELRSQGCSVAVLQSKYRKVFTKGNTARIMYQSVNSHAPSTLFLSRPLLPSGDDEARIVLFYPILTANTINALKAAIELLRSESIQVSSVVTLFSDDGTETQLRADANVDVAHLGSVQTLPTPALPTSLSEAPKTILPEFALYSETPLPTLNGDVRFFVFTSTNGNAICVIGKGGKIDHSRPVLVRVHDACITSECFHSAKCDCREQLEASLEVIQREGGMVIYLLQEGRGIGLAAKISAYALQQTKALDTVEANRALGLPDDIRSYTAARDILHHFEIQSIELLSNNPRKKEKLHRLGVAVAGYRPIVVPPNSEYCRRYLETKASRMNHRISFLEGFPPTVPSIQSIRLVNSDEGKESDRSPGTHHLR